MKPSAANTPTPTWVDEQISETLGRRRADVVAAPSAEPVHQQRRIAERQAQLYSEFRFDRLRLLTSLEAVVEQIRCGSHPRLMRALQGLHDPISIGMCIAESMRDCLIDAAREAAEAETAERAVLEGGAA